MKCPTQLYRDYFINQMGWFNHQPFAEWYLGLSWRKVGFFTSQGMGGENGMAAPPKPYIFHLRIDHWSCFISQEVVVLTCFNTCETWSMFFLRNWGGSTTKIDVICYLPLRITGLMDPPKTRGVWMCFFQGSQTSLPHQFLRSHGFLG